jgi:predicted dehydrogenase
MTKLTAIIIGCGAIAREHLRALRNIPEVKVAAVCDLSPARAEAAAERFKVERWDTDYKKLLSEFRPDLVHIATPPLSHFSIASECLEKGLNVFCEKPITPTYDEYKSLQSLAEKNGAVIIENQNLRCHSSVLRIQELINSGQFGDIVDVQVLFSLPLTAVGSPYIDENAPHFGAALPGGVIGDFLPHIAYLTLMFTGPVSESRSIWRKYSNSPLKADDFRALVKGQRASGCVGFSGTSSVTGYWLRVAGTEMYAEANLLEPPRVTLRRHRPGEAALMSVVDGMAESRDVFFGTLRAFSRKLAGSSSYDGLEEFIRRIYAALSDKGKLPVSTQEIGEAVRLVETLASESVRI